MQGIAAAADVAVKDQPERAGQLQRRRAVANGRRVVLAVFGVTRLAIALSGRAFAAERDLGASWQLLDPKLLGAHPFRSVFYLHTQPPLFNLFVGVVIRWTPLNVDGTFHGLYLLCGLVLALSLYALLVELGAPPWMATVATCVVIASPYVATNEQVLTYELPVATMLVLATWACTRYVKRRSLASFSAFVVLTTAIVLTRSLFHWVWLLAVVGGVLLLARPRASWRKVALVCALAFVLVGGVIVKNAVLFDSPSLSSWSGMNFARSAIWPIPRKDLIQLERQGVLSRAAIVPPFSSYWQYEWLQGPCRADHRDPVLTSPTKSTGQNNFNATCYLPLYRQAGRDAKAAILHRPRRFLESRTITGVKYLSNTEAYGSSSDTSVMKALRAVYQPFYLPLPVRLRVSDWAFSLGGSATITGPISLTVLGWLIAVIVRGLAALLRIIRGRGRDLDAVWAFIGVTFLFVTFASLVGDLGENARFRALIDPLLLGIMAWDLCRFGAWIAAKVRAGGAGPASQASDESDGADPTKAAPGSGALTRPAAVR